MSIRLPLIIIIISLGFAIFYFLWNKPYFKRLKNINIYPDQDIREADKSGVFD